NVQTLIDIYQQLKQSKFEYNLIIAGDGAAREEAEMLMPTAHFLGKLDHTELSKLYAPSDVFVFTSTSETYGNVVIEAMASGRTYGIGNGGGSFSLIDLGRNGYKCVPNNALEYVYFIPKILSDSGVKTEFQHAGWNYVRKLDWGKL